MKKIYIKIMVLILVFVLVLTIIHLIIKKIEYDIVYNKRINEIIADNFEVERKWLIDKNKIPLKLSNAEILEIEQTYISFSPEIRVRKINNGEEYTFAVKTNMTVDGLVRSEMEENITKEEYNSLIKKKEGNTIYKTRYQFFNEGNIYAIDIFDGKLEGLAYLEIEFLSREEAEKFLTPEWVIKDVTNDIRYKNGFLARYGVPSE